MSVRFKNAGVSKKMPLNIIVYSGMRGNRFRVGVRAKNVPACRGLRVGPSEVTPLLRGTEAPKTSALLNFGAVREGRMIRVHLSEISGHPLRDPLRVPFSSHSRGPCRPQASCPLITNPGTTPIILAVNSDHGLSFAGEETGTMV